MIDTSQELGLATSYEVVADGSVFLVGSSDCQQGLLMSRLSAYVPRDGGRPWTCPFSNTQEQRAMQSPRADFDVFPSREQNLATNNVPGHLPQCSQACTHLLQSSDLTQLSTMPGGGPGKQVPMPTVSRNASESCRATAWLAVAISRSTCHCRPVAVPGGRSGARRQPWQSTDAETWMQQVCS